MLGAVFVFVIIVGLAQFVGLNTFMAILFAVACFVAIVEWDNRGCN